MPPTDIATSDTLADSIGESATVAAEKAEPTPVAEPPAPVGVGDQVGRFQIVRKLGAGGMGTVFVARDHELHRDLAIKVLHPSEGDSEASQGQQRILREAQAMAMVNHPHLVTIYDVGTHAGSVYLAMEYVEGLTLDRWLASAPIYETIVRVFLEAGSALQAIHEAGLVHRDFKPGNVMVTKDGHARVLDLGIARRRGSGGAEIRTTGDRPPLRPAAECATTLPKLAGDDDDATLAQTRDAFGGELTQLGALVGTPRYMSPEQIRGQPAGPAADQFAFALSFVEALTGAHAFEGRGALMIMNAIDVGERRPWPETEPPGPRLRAVLDRALANEAADRYAAMADLLAAIRTSAGLRSELGRLVDHWRAHGEDDEYLLGPGERLEQARRLLTEDQLGEDERRFLLTSLGRVRRRRIQRRALLGGLASLGLALPAAVWLVDRRTQQLDQAVRESITAELEALRERIEPHFRAAETQIALIHDQRELWSPRLAELRGPGSIGEPELARRLEAAITRVNAYFQPIVDRWPVISSLEVSQGDDLALLCFRDPDASQLDPPYGFYNRFVWRERFGDAIFEVFWPERGDPWSRWLEPGQLDTRGRVWAGYHPSSRPWQKRARAAIGEIAWTPPYLFFISKDAGTTGAIAWTEGGSDGGSLHAVAVDFMLTDLSRITTTSSNPQFHTFVVSKGRLVAVPRLPQFRTDEQVRAFFRIVDAARRATAGTPTDVPAELPTLADLELPEIEAAVATRGDEPVFAFEHAGERLWAGTRPVGPSELELELWVVQRPRGQW